MTENTTYPMAAAVRAAYDAGEEDEGSGISDIPGWLDKWPEARFYRAPIWFLISYVLVFFSYNVIVSIFFLVRLMKLRPIKLWLFHPDKCGGLSAIGEFNTKIGIMLAAIGLVLCFETLAADQAGSLDTTHLLILGICLYLASAPVFFFLPLMSAHKIMEEEKDQELLHLAHRYESLYREAVNSLSTGEGDHTSLSKRLEKLKELYTVASNFPVWPFDAKNVRRFFASVGSPFVITLITKIAEKIVA